MRVHAICFALTLLFGAPVLAGCQSQWETTSPSAEVASPYEDVYRGLSTAKFWGATPAKVEVSETVATVTMVAGSTVYTRAIAFADVDVQLMHHTKKDKWVVEIYESNGKLLLRTEATTSKKANELAAALVAVQGLLSSGG